MTKTAKKSAPKPSTSTPLAAAVGLLQHDDDLGQQITHASAPADAAIGKGLTFDSIVRAIEEAAARQHGRSYLKAHRGFKAMPFSETNDHVCHLRAMEMEAAFGVGFVVAARLFGGAR